MTNVHVANSDQARSEISTQLYKLGFSPNISQRTMILRSETKGFLVGLLDDAKRGYLSYIYVEEKYRRNGIGTALLKEFTSIARQRSLDRIFIPGYTGNAPEYIQPGINVETEKSAIKLVEKFDFKECGKVFSMERSLEKTVAIPRTSKWEIRIPAWNDRDELIDAIANSVPGEWSTLFEKKLKLHSSEMLIAIQDRVVVAYCSWNQDRFGPIGVRQEFRGKGLGKLLLAHSLDRMKRAGSLRAWFSWSDEENVKFYENSGFRVTNRYSRFNLDLKEPSHRTN